MTDTEFARRCAYCGEIVTIEELREVDAKFAEMDFDTNEAVCDALGLIGLRDETKWYDNYRIYHHLDKTRGKLYNVCIKCLVHATELTDELVILW